MTAYVLKKVLHYLATASVSYFYKRWSHYSAQCTGKLFCSFSWKPGHENWEKSWNPGQNLPLMLSVSWIPRQCLSWIPRHYCCYNDAFTAALWLVRLFWLIYIWKAEELKLFQFYINGNCFDLFSHPLEFNSRRDAANRVKHKVVKSRKFMISAIWLVHFAKLTFLWNPGHSGMPTVRTAKHLLLESTKKSVESGTYDVICQFCTVKGMVVESEVLKAQNCALSKLSLPVHSNASYTWKSLRSFHML